MQMGMSKSHLQRIGEFVRKVTKAPTAETIVSETFQVLKQVAKIERLRVVYAAVPAQWTEWKCAPDGLEVRMHEEWPSPEKKSRAAFFDPDNQQSGYISSSSANENVRSALDLLAPEVWSAFLL